MFFKKFPTVQLEIDGRQFQYDDLYRFVDVDRIIAQNSTNYDWYDIGDGERPDHVSQNMYKTPDFYWTFFIINERLKHGISEWPLSNNNLEHLIQQKYGRYGVLSIVPTFWGGKDQTVDMKDFSGRIDTLDEWGYILDLNIGWEFPRPLTNLLHGIDMSHPKLRIRRFLAKEYPARHAKIAYWDPYRYQVWISDVNDPFFYRSLDNNANNSRVELFLLDPTDEEQEKWIESFKNKPGADFDDHSGVLTVYVDRFHENAYNAPSRFIIRGTDLPYRAEYIHMRGGNAVSYLEEERQKNEEKRRIRVIKPELIYDFTERYKHVLNSTGRLDV